MADKEGEYLLGLYEECRQDLEKIFGALDNLESLAGLCDQRLLKGIYQDNAERAQTHLEFISKLLEIEEKMLEAEGQEQNSSIRAMPIHFIIPNSDKQLEVNPEALKKLEGLSGPLVIISVAGLFRTGKSYILNRLAGQQRGFMLGPNVQSCTKGIWLWCTPLTVKRDGLDAQIILLDTEGLGDSEKGDQNYDTSIFALAILLSSYFIYNSMRTIDEEALQSLYLVGEMASRIQVKSGEEDSEERKREFPAFCWLVRDSELALPEGQSAKDHMEDILKLKAGASKKIKAYNDPRELIKQLFPKRECFLLRKPVEVEEQLRRVDQLSQGQLHPDFVEQSESFVQRVFSRVPIKKVLGKNISGIELGSLANSFVQAINDGAIPVISDAFTSLVEVHGNRAVNLATTTYKDSMLNLITIHRGFPLSERKLAEFHEQSLEETNMQFARSCMQETERFGPLLAINVNEIYNKTLDDNKATAQAVCQANLQTFYQPIKEKLLDMTYLNNPDNLIEDIQDLTAFYISETEDLPGNSDILNDFLGSEIEQVMKKLQSSVQAKEEKSKEMATERQKRDQVSSELEQSKKRRKEAEEKKRKMQEDQKEQEKELTRQMRDEVSRNEGQNRGDLMAQERRLREQTERSFADMQSSLGNNMRSVRDEISQLSSARQRDIDNLHAQLNSLRNNEQQLRNQKY